MTRATEPTVGAMMAKRSICILGGTGFVGRHVASRLVKAGHRVRVLTRHRERHRDLLVLPTLELVEADVHDESTLREQFAGYDAVINVVGILNEKGDSGQGFRAAHPDLAEKVVQACRDTGVGRLLHMSALHADAERGVSHYLRSKGAAEDLVQRAATYDFRVTSFRPSVIFGPGDSFLNRFARLLKWSPGLFPLACAHARFAPVFVGDVAEVMSRALDNPHTYGQRYALCGPHTYTLQQLVEYTAALIGVRQRVVPLGRTLSRLQAEILEHAPGKPFSRDNYRSLQIDSVCEEPFPTIFGLTPATLEAEAPRYLALKTYRARFTDFRRGI